MWRAQTAWTNKPMKGGMKFKENKKGQQSGGKTEAENIHRTNITFNTISIGFIAYPAASWPPLPADPAAAGPWPRASRPGRWWSRSCPPQRPTSVCSSGAGQMHSGRPRRDLKGIATLIEKPFEAWEPFGWQHKDNPIIMLRKAQYNDPLGQKNYPSYKVGSTPVGCGMNFDPCFAAFGALLAACFPASLIACCPIHAQ